MLIQKSNMMLQICVISVLLFCGYASFGQTQKTAVEENILDDPYFERVPKDLSKLSKLEKAEFEAAKKAARDFLLFCIEDSRKDYTYEERNKYIGDRGKLFHKLCITSKTWVGAYAYVTAFTEIHGKKILEDKIFSSMFITPSSPYGRMSFLYWCLNPKLPKNLHLAMFREFTPARRVRGWMPEYLYLKMCEPFILDLEEKEVSPMYKYIPAKTVLSYLDNTYVMKNVDRYISSAYDSLDEAALKSLTTQLHEQWPQILSEAKRRYDDFKVLSYWYVRQKYTAEERAAILARYIREFPVVYPEFADTKLREIRSLRNYINMYHTISEERIEESIKDIEAQEKIDYIDTRKLYEIRDIHLSAVDAAIRLKEQGKDASFENKLADMTYDLLNNYLKAYEIEPLKMERAKTLEKAREWFLESVGQILKKNPSEDFDPSKIRSVDYRGLVLTTDVYTPNNKIPAQ